MVHVQHAICSGLVATSVLLPEASSIFTQHKLLTCHTISIMQEDRVCPQSRVVQSAAILKLSWLQIAIKLTLLMLLFAHALLSAKATNNEDVFALGAKSLSLMYGEAQGPPGMPPMMMGPRPMGAPGQMPPLGMGMPPPGLGMPPPGMPMPGMPPRPGMPQMQAPPGGFRPPQSKCLRLVGFNIFATTSNKFTCTQHALKFGKAPNANSFWWLQTATK